jgi:hypothetical protein
LWGWAGAGRGDETGKEKQAGFKKLGQRANRIYKWVSNFQNLRFKQNSIGFKRILFET